MTIRSLVSLESLSYLPLKRSLAAGVLAYHDPTLFTRDIVRKRFSTRHVLSYILVRELC